MNEATFWADTLRADVFWQALSSIFMFFAVSVALIVPYVQAQSRSRRACKLVVSELLSNREALDSFDYISEMLEIFRESDGDNVMVNESALQFFNDAAVRKISVSTWTAVWTEIPAEKVACYRMAYDLFAPVLEPKRFVSFGGDHLIENQVAIRIQKANIAKAHFDKLKENCSFFRI